jgi:hypothetical protein
MVNTHVGGGRVRTGLERNLAVDEGAKVQFERALTTFCKRQSKDAESEPGPQLVSVLRGKDLAMRVLEITKQLPASDPAWVCGGFPRWLCSPHQEPALPMDVDILPATELAFELCVSLFLEAGWSDAHEGRKRPDARAVMSKAPLCNLVGPPDVQGTLLQFLQIVRPYQAPFAVVGARTAAEQLAGLDFSVTRVVLIDENMALADARFLRDEFDRRIVIRHIVCPISSCARISKYESKGYTIQGRERVKLFAEWSKRALEASASPSTATPEQILLTFAELSDNSDLGTLASFYRQMYVD